MGEHLHPANIARHDERTFGERAADGTTQFMGSWRFIAAQTVFIAVWITLNVVGGVRHWDPYTFTLLNLLFSVQAAYASPLILLAQNRSAEHDRLKAEHDYQTNQRALELIEGIARGEIVLAVGQVKLTEQVEDLTDELRS